ncbi:ArsI/CadI family heavy metal resistance metalloenzyme [Tunicatimonas pelagia]|uniref:ArsI/CadI family heavy metal resistance metalloenzyme n=1 Tax=Tunicatimonas pelagia TaxID=931531 RepID=UPI002666660A|nr:ArsI/CadI family heavy metal resistance metalloenzyme [Tunicatimonas pelagia]WKN43326.1 ArsI/CadI family heavy metal resistance metalloenzyme [Tunicatimonas pelagia]
MKRLHINVKVQDLAASVAFYEGLFASKPTVLKPDYAKWMLDDPLVNFSINLSSNEGGVEHLGIQVETEKERNELFNRLDQIKGEQFKEGETVCCYAHSTKSWIADPQGIPWEIFQTHGASHVNRAPVASLNRHNGTCCAN